MTSELTAPGNPSALSHLELRRPCLFVASEERHLVPAGGLADLVVVSVLSVEAASAVCIVPRFGLVELRAFPSGYLGAVAWSRSGGARLAALSALFGRWSGRMLPAVTALGQEGPGLDSHGREHRDGDFYRACATLLFGNHARLLKTAGDTLRELGALRAGNEELRRDFAVAEAFILSRNVQPLQLVFDNPVSARGEAVSGAARHVSQIVPAASYGLSSIDIAVGTGGGGASFGLDATLASVESGEVLSRWSLSLDDIVPGWINLGLPRGLSAAAHTLRLDLHPLNGIGVLPPLLLGDAQPLRAFRAVVTGEPAVPVPTAASLALRCWSGLPGVAPSSSAAAVRPERADGRPAVHTVPIPLALLATVEGCVGDWRPDFSPVSFDAADAYVECHPPPAGITLGRLPRMVLPTACRIDAQAYLRSAQASPVEFGLLFTDAADAEILAGLAAGGSHAAHAALGHFSGWVTADAATAALVMCAVPRGGETGRITLATRMKGGACSDFAWACFRNFRVTSLAVPDAPEAAAEAVSTRRLARHDFARFAVEHGREAACRVSLARGEPALEARVAGHDTAIVTLRGLDAPSALKVAARAAAHGDGPVEVGLGVFDGGVGRALLPIDLEAPQSPDTRLVFSGWTEIHPAEAAVFEIEVDGACADRLAVLLAVRSGTGATPGIVTMPGIVTISDLWIIGRDEAA